MVSLMDMLGCPLGKTGNEFLERVLGAKLEPALARQIQHTTDRTGSFFDGILRHGRLHLLLVIRQDQDLAPRSTVCEPEENTAVRLDAGENSNLPGQVRTFRGSFLGELFFPAALDPENARILEEGDCVTVEDHQLRCRGAPFLVLHLHNGTYRRSDNAWGPKVSYGPRMIPLPLTSSSFERITVVRASLSSACQGEECGW